MKPLVSILISAYDAEKWIGYTLQSAIAQTWPRKEIVVVDDGSRDGTAEIARRFASKEVRIVSCENQGAAGARNHALQLSQGDYIQWLDADDLLAPDKIARQFAALKEVDNKRILLSSPWARFYYRTHRARFVPTSLWHDLTPVEWLLRKMGQNLHMQTATWLTSRELAEAAGPWDTRLLSDDDGEYFCRVLLASQRTCFAPEPAVFYRITPSSRLSRIGASDRKKDAMLISMKLHVQYLRSLEDSERTRHASLVYLQNWYHNFYPERPDIVGELQNLAAELQGRLEEPHLRWKYAWLKPIFGWKTAKSAQDALPEFRKAIVRQWDKTMYGLEGSGTAAKQSTSSQFGSPSVASSASPIEPSRVQSCFTIESVPDGRTPRIPQRIIQTGKNVRLSLQQRAVVSNLKLLHPGYEYLFFDNAKVGEFVDREFPQYRRVFDSFLYPIQRYDFFRYLAVYRYGGFYFDLDVLLASDLSELLEHDCVFPFEALNVSRFLRKNLGMDWLMGNYAFGAAPGHGFLEAVIENCVKGQRDSNWVKPMMRGSPPLLDDEFFILNSTGPGLVSRTLAENPDLAKTVTVLFPDDVCDLKNWNCFGDWGVHLAESSWRPKRSFVRRKFSDYCWRWIQNTRVKQGVQLGKLRSHPRTKQVYASGQPVPIDELVCRNV